MDSRRRAIIGIAKSGGGLPSEYQEVEYLESTGEQWITTNITLSSASKIEIDAHLIGGFGISAGVGQGLSDTGYFIFRFSSKTVEVYYDGGKSANYAMTNDRHTFFYDRVTSTYGYDNNTFSFTKKSNVSSEHLVMLVWRESGRNYYPCTGKFYGLKWYENNVLQHDFIPCYRKADNKPGMYDLVNDVFYTNANTSASTDFIVGPNV